MPTGIDTCNNRDYKLTKNAKHTKTMCTSTPVNINADQICTLDNKYQLPHIY